MTKQELWEKERNDFITYLNSVIKDVQTFNYGEQNNAYVICELQKVTAFGIASSQEMYGMLSQAKLRTEAEWSRPHIIKDADELVKYINENKIPPEENDGGQLVN